MNLVNYWLNCTIITLDARLTGIRRKPSLFCKTTDCYNKYLRHIQQCLVSHVCDISSVRYDALETKIDGEHYER